MKIYDCFSYWDEDLLLDMRLNVLNDYVDYFVIVEGNKTWQNNPKKLQFDIEKFKNFKDKIIYIPVEDMPDGDDPYLRENFQRNAILRGLISTSEDDLIIISDLDEIPNLKEIKNLDKYKFTVFQQKLFFYKFNAQIQQHHLWFGSKICKKKYLKSPQWLRKQKVKKNPFWKFYKVKWNIIKDGGGIFLF